MAWQGRRAGGAGGGDDTVRLRPGPHSGPRRRAGLGLALALGGALLVALAAFGGWVALRPVPWKLAGERTIFAHVGGRFTVFRFRPDKLILVVDCPGLHAQGLMFDRIAALIEKADAPRDRVLSAASFRRRLVAADLTIGTYYYGNDYPASALRRFFRLAAAQHQALNPEELRLRAIARRAGFLAAGANGAIISIPQAGGKHRLGWRARAVILRHELSHGGYFTLPAYREFVHRFYDTTMTPAERTAFRGFLTRQGYDPRERGLIVNETIAYLIFTRDPDYFRASAVGLPDTTVAALRTQFEAAMPDSWLRTMATAPLPVHR